MDHEARDRDEGYQSPPWQSTWMSHDVLQRLERDDDDVNEYLEGFNFVDAGSWIEGAGRIISKTTRLKEMDLWFTTRGSDGQNAWIHELCEGLSRNRTIEKLSLFLDMDDEDVDCIVSLTPFFVHNDNLRCLEVSRIPSRTSCDLDALLKILSKCKSGLEFIKLELGMSDSQQVIFFNSLSEMHSNLLELWISSKLGKMGTIALANVLMNPACKIRLLQMNSGITYYDDDCVLHDAMIENSSIKSLHMTRSPRLLYLSSI